MSALNQRWPEQPLEAWLKELQPRLRALFSRYRIPAEDTEDLLQQALLALVYQGSSVRDPEAWLFGTLRNKCLIYWRERRRRLYEGVDLAVLDWMAEPQAPHQERADLWTDLETLVRRLPPNCQELLRLRYLLGYKPAEVAKHLGYKISSIRKITTRCLAALTRELVLVEKGAPPKRKKGKRSGVNAQEEIEGEEGEDQVGAPDRDESR